MSGKTDLQREILLTWYNNPDITNKEIAEACDCSASYVSQIKNRFDDYNEFEAMMDRQDRQMEQMFDDDIFASGALSAGQTGSGDQQGFIELWQELPNDTTGIIIKAVIVLLFLIIGYQAALILF